VSQLRNIIAVAVPSLLALGCQSGKTKPKTAAHPTHIDAGVAAGPSAAHVPPVTPWDTQGPLGPGETYALAAEGPRRTTVAEARKQGLCDVDLSDEWAPFIFSENDGPSTPTKPNPYRSTFIRLANDRASPEEILMETPQGALAAMSAAGISLEKGAAQTREARRAIAEAKAAVRVQRDRNYLEAYGIPPTLSVLLSRIEEDRDKACHEEADLEGLAGFAGTASFQSREQARKEYNEALSDASWVEKLLAGDRSAADATTGKVQLAPPDKQTGSDEGRTAMLASIAKSDRRLAKRIERYRRGQVRLRAIRALQARLVCEGLLIPRVRHTQGIFDLPTHEALAAWERKNDIFGWGFLGGETLAALQRPVMELHLDTFRRVLMERIADGAAILEDGSASGGAQSATYKDAGGQEHPVPNLIGDYADALMAALGIHNAKDVATFLRRVGRQGLVSLHVAFRPPPLPPYYGRNVSLSVEIDRGDVWYDFPFDEDGHPVVQERKNFPTLTVLAHWRSQKIPLVRWRTTIGSWRSETQKDGKVYFKYKNSDVGPRIWKEIVASPVWIPPDGTPTKELLTRKTLDRDKGAVTVVNTDVMGPGFQSAYGLVAAIHHRSGGGKLYDNGIRTHGSVDYTSIARRYSHGCHRLVNSRAVRLFDFILHRRPFERVGNQPMVLRKHFTHEDQEYEYLLDTRGYYYELKQPIPVVVTRGNVKGKRKFPMPDYVQKPGVDYGEEEESESGP
jgi:hypothetical protein